MLPVTNFQPRAKGDGSQSPNSLKVNGLAKNALFGHMYEWIVLLLFKFITLIDIGTLGGVVSVSDFLFSLPAWG